MLLQVVLVDHLAQLHLTLSNMCNVAVREALESDHPLRRLFKPFLFRTTIINYNAFQAVFAYQ